MQIPNVDHIRYVRNEHMDRGFHHLNFRNIYEAINRREDFSETQLFYLGGLVGRKLKTFEHRLNADYLEAKPQQTKNDSDMHPDQRKWERRQDEKITQIKECRQNPRFKIQGMVIAVVRPSSHPPGNIKEISRSGLMFQYRENGNSRMIPQELDIIWSDYVAIHHLEKIPVRIVSDILIEKGARSGKYATRRQTVAFENLTPCHENQLGRLIRARGAIPL